MSLSNLKLKIPMKSTKYAKNSLDSAQTSKQPLARNEERQKPKTRVSLTNLELGIRRDLKKATMRTIARALKKGDRLSRNLRPKMIDCKQR